MNFLRPDDRRVLDEVILPYVAAQSELKRVLFVGCTWYTQGYESLFSNREYWTLDFDPEQRKYGAKNRHIVDSIANLGAHFSTDALDLIICSGVFGFGLNAKPDAEAAFAACYSCLREGGMFVLGWNDIVERRPYYPEESASLSRFEPYIFPPLEGAVFLTASPIRHTFNFYVKPQARNQFFSAGP